MHKRIHDSHRSTRRTKPASGDRRLLPYPHKVSQCGWPNIPGINTNEVN